jgi:uncharacterized RDD family membrane protein YckC
MALVASPARVSPGSGSLTQHGPQPSPSSSDGYQHPHPATSSDPSFTATALPSARTQPGTGGQVGQEPQSAITSERYCAAGFFRRAAAAFIDLALLLPVWAASGLALCLVFGQPIPRLAELSPDILLAALLDGNAASEALLALSGILLFLYFFLFHAARGQTPGKQLLGLRVIDAYGNRPGVPRTLLRTLAYALSALPFSLGFLWIGFDRERRALHDWVASTYVVRVP